MRLGAAFFWATAVAITPAAARDLTWDDRIRAQQAIEQVHYSHQTGATLPFDQAVPRPLLEREVRTYLQQSAALERVWNTPVTAIMLQRELERVERGSRMPGRLQELFDALGRDPVVVQECLIRPILVDRLTRGFFASDARFHERARAAAEALHGALAAGRIDPKQERPDRMVVDVPAGASLAPGLERSGQVGPIEDDTDAFRIRVALSPDGEHHRQAVFAVPKRTWDEWWTDAQSSLDTATVRAVATDTGLTVVQDAGAGGGACSDDQWANGSLDDVPEARQDHLAFWTGSLMLIWGGSTGFAPPVRGARYDPATDTWTPMSRTGMPTTSGFYSGVWTGTEMVLWGSVDESGTLVAVGGRYDPATDTWRGVSQLNAPDTRGGHSAVWTGSVMIVWGGSNGEDGQNYLATGGRYDPATDTWYAMSPDGAPEARADHSAVWTGDRMLVWGGGQAWLGIYFDTGGRYDPATDTWSSMSTVDAPTGRANHVTVWTGTRMVVWGGFDPSGKFNTGGRYDPVADQWLPTSINNAPSAREQATGIWTGSHMIVWGGNGGPNSSVSADGGRYDPVQDQWTPMNPGPDGRRLHTAVWTGSLMILWGGFGSGVSINTGGRYDPATNSWTPTSLRPLSPRESPAAVWTGSALVVWGGRYTGDGARYDPATDSWTPTATAGAPSPRAGPSAVWTGDRMVVFGGASFNPSTGRPIYLTSGGRYDPVADHWDPMTLAPIVGRLHHTAIWTGSTMLVWGGSFDTFNPQQTQYPNDGARYDPIHDTWSFMNSADAPSGRAWHSSIWTGSRMIVWGGVNASGNQGDGKLYDPGANLWSPMPAAGAPTGRQQHTAVWTGSRMIVWGGWTGPSRTDTGAAYDPASQTWTTISAAGAPAPRYAHGALWTGSLMIVWGGDAQGADLPSTGGRYDPETDQWFPMSGVEAPFGRISFGAVWMSDRMAVWGGFTYGTYLNDGGMYCACSGPLMTLYRDADGDGRGDPGMTLRGCAGAVGYVADATDCDDGDASVWGTPSEVPGVVFLDHETLAWNAPGDPGAAAFTFDILRSPTAGDFTGAATCEASGTPAISLVDASTPVTGQAFFYLVRALDACPSGGVGTLGSDSSGLPRTGRACP